MSDDLILVDRDASTVWATLNRPHALNALKWPDTFAALRQVLADVRRDPSVKALVLTGAGEKAFCIGSDLAVLEAALRSPDLRLFRDYLEEINSFLFELEDLPVPTVAMVQGRARAGGFELILACDFVIMAEEARIGDVHTPFGHMPGAGATQRLARKVGLPRALEIILTGRWLTAQEAGAIGLALTVVPRAELREITGRFASRFASMPRGCLQHSKRALLRGWDLPLREGVRLEVGSYLEYLATSPEPRAQFLERLERRRESVRAEADFPLCDERE